MSWATWRLVLLVSLAHAMAHVLELSLPSVEQWISADYFPQDPLGGKRAMGLLQTAWRLPWGLGALPAGWLVDRLGSKRMLAVFLLGAAAVSVLVGMGPPLPWLFVLMFAMGGLACIYHPAGLALISHRVAPDQLPRALGIHGVIGSLGIGATPLMAGLLLAGGGTWSHYYWVLAVPGALLGTLFIGSLFRDGTERNPADSLNTPRMDDDPADWPAFFTLTILALSQGFVYSAVLGFLPRYLSDMHLVLGQASGWSAESQGALISGGVLLLGCLGQFLAGTFARSDKLEQQLTLVTLANTPCLIWMAMADGWQRAMAAGLFALVHFMHQPLYNSLIARYSPRRRRSVCYGFSFAMGLGVGSFGATFAGYSLSNAVTYGTLSGVALGAALLGGALWRRAVWRRRQIG